MNASVLGLTPAEINERFADIVAFADIDEFIEQPVKTYSSGMMMRLAFAVIAYVDADILIIDEALAVGDAFLRKNACVSCVPLCAQVRYFLVSHDTNSIKIYVAMLFGLKKGWHCKRVRPKRFVIFI